MLTISTTSSTTIQTTALAGGAASQSPPVVLDAPALPELASPLVLDELVEITPLALASSPP